VARTSKATLDQARAWGREDAKDAIMLAREAPSEIDRMTMDFGGMLGPEYSSDRAGKPARRLVSEWDGIHEQLSESGRIRGIPRDRPLAALLPGATRAWEAGGQEALDAHGDAFYEELDAADVFLIDTYAYPSADPQFQDIDGEPVFSLYVVDGRRFSEFHQEHWLGQDFGTGWRLAEENVQKVYTEPMPSLRERIERVFRSES
jgi:hypothetical protein